jgi:hypothetical protein
LASSRRTLRYAATLLTRVDAHVCSSCAASRGAWWSVGRASRLTQLALSRSRVALCQPLQVLNDDGVVVNVVHQYARYDDVANTRYHQGRLEPNRGLDWTNSGLPKPVNAEKGVSRGGSVNSFVFHNSENSVFTVGWCVGVTSKDERDQGSWRRRQPGKRVGGHL